MKYFQQVEKGKVYRVAGTDLAALYEADPTYTEVQVVPIDAIVIRRDELPEVHPEGHGSVTIGGHIYGTAYGYREHRGAALRMLALIEYLREHPPVDEAQVDALRDILLSTRKPADARPVEDQYKDVARRLVERGVRVEQP